MSSLTMLQSVCNAMETAVHAMVKCHRPPDRRFYSGPEREGVSLAAFNCTWFNRFLVRWRKWYCRVNLFYGCEYP